jgi:hypothetical protein
MPGMVRGPKKYNDLQLACAVATCRTMRDVLIELGLAPYGGNYENVWKRIHQLRLDASHLRTFRRGKRLSACSDEEIIEVVRKSRSLAQVLNALGFKQSGGRQATLRARIAAMGLDTSHLLGEGWRRGCSVPVIPAKPLNELLIRGRLVPTNGLKKRLIAEGLKQARCESCGRDQWNGKPIPLELDHINGRRDDNRMSNLRILCPNCHAQTDTFRGRNIGSAALSSRGPGGGMQTRSA